MATLSGSVYHQIDDKGRIRIPSKFKTALGSNVWFVGGDQDCIYVYSDEKFAIVSGKNADHLSPLEKKARRKIFGSAEDLKEDGQGRVRLSPALLRRLGIQDLKTDDGNLVSIGMEDHIEIWKPDKFEEYSSDMSFEEAYQILNL